MRQFLYLSVFCVLALAACTGSFKKGDNGLEYKIISKGNGKTLKYGDYMQIHLKQIYKGAKDSVLLDSWEEMPRIQMFDSASTPPAYYKILRQVRKGDSLIIRVLTDTAFKNSQMPMPEFMKKGKYIYTYVKMVNIFETREQADSANKAEMALAKPRFDKLQREAIEKEIAKNKKLIDEQGKVIADYLAKNNIKAEKGKWGTYVSIQTEGTGEKANDKSIVTVNYTGKTFDSSIVFDSNVDPKFKHVQSYQVKMTDVGTPNGVILGWGDALKQLKKGSKATIYIPSSLGYGPDGNGREIKGGAILVFDIEVLDIMTEEQAAAQQEEIQKQIMDAERARVDSIQKASKK